MHPHQAVLRLFAGYAGLVAAVCGVRAPAQPGALAALAVGHALAAALLWRRSRIPAPADRRHLLTPYLLWFGSWLLLGRIFAWSDPATHDAAVAAVDLAVFGGPWHMRLGRLLDGASVSQAMQLVYVSYYGIVAGPPLVLAARGRTARCERFTLVLMATYVACFAVYLVYPVLGPRAVAEAAAEGARAASAGAAGLAELARRVGDSPGTAFPSSHCAAAMAAALAAGAGARPAVRAALVAWAALIAVATVHTGNHYTLDSAVGLGLGLGVAGAAGRLLSSADRLGAGRG